METAPPASDGIIGSFRTLGHGLLSTVHDRVELFSLELQEEKFRLIQTFIWICAAVFSGMMAITFVSLTLVFFFWESARLAVLGGVTLFYVGAFVAIVVGFRRFIARLPTPFAATRQELSEDRACILRQN
ncbi:MAG: phage holin family protein [Verrucomicrobia bacterium]|nr:phage holin family protein [Verrucomicrobiota bacterium]